MEAQTPSSEHWVESAPQTRSHTPSSVHSHTAASAAVSGSDHFMTNINNGVSSGTGGIINDKVSPPGINFSPGNFMLNVAANRERDTQQNSRYWSTNLLNTQILNVKYCVPGCNMHIIYYPSH